MKLLIAESEYSGGRDVRDILSKISPHINTSTANSPVAALQMLRANAYDGVLFDAVWPTRSYAEIVQELGPQCPPFAFLTDHPEFAVTAFELGAVDYLVKPFDPDRMDIALARMEAKSAATVVRPVSSEENLMLNDGDSIWVVKPKEIYLIQAIQNYCKVYFRMEQVFIRRSLNDLYDRLAPHGFFRMSRDWIVNIGQIEQCSTTVARTLKVKLIGGMELEMSRRQTKVFRERYSL